MSCMFCKADAASSRSVEHIIPESLGNREIVLPAGVVCDPCNNYFARKVEQPFIDLPVIRMLRFMHAVPNKRDRINPVQGRVDVGEGIPVTVTKFTRGQFGAAVVTSDREIMLKLQQNARAEVVFGAQSGPKDQPRIVSRFLAKVALEWLAAVELRVTGEWASLLRPELDAIRRYTRFNEGNDWPISVRTIYRDDALWHHPDGRVTHHAWMMAPWLFTSRSTPSMLAAQWPIDGSVQGDAVFVAAFMGREIAINLSRSSIERYREWVWRHPGDSLLFRVLPGHILDRPGYVDSVTFPSGRDIAVVYRPDGH